MKRLRLTDLDPVAGAHILAGIIPGRYLNKGGIGFKAPGQRSHDHGCQCRACDGMGRHVHPDDHEAFIILQGRGVIEIDGVSHPVRAGDVIICEPGEDHHLVADPDDPCVNVYLHAGDQRHVAQTGAAAVTP